MRTNRVWPKINLKTFTGRGKWGGELGGRSNLEDKANVNEEYKEAFRTQSYVEMWGKVQCQLSSTTALHRFSSALIDPPQQPLLDALAPYNPDPLLTDYFHSTFQACNLCESLLRSVHQARAGDRRIRRVIKLSQRLQDGPEERYCRAILEELATFAMLSNPLSEITPARFRDIHDGNTALLRRMTSKRRKMRRRARAARWWKKAGGVGHGAVMVAFLALAIHSMVGMVAVVPGMVACGVEMARKRGKRKAGPERLLDVGAKGAYILVKDVDTMSRLVMRLHDEVEHRRTAAEVCLSLRSAAGGKAQVLKEVVRNLSVNESGFLEQLEELERHIHLCFLTINRSRRLLAHHILLGIGTPTNS